MSWQISECSLTLNFSSKPIPSFVKPRFETAIKYFQRDPDFMEICQILKLASQNASLKNLTYYKKELSITFGFSSICDINVFKEALDDLEASIATKKE